MSARLKAAFVAVAMTATALVGGLATTAVLAPAAGAYTTSTASFSSLSCGSWVSATAPANAIRAEFEIWGGGGEGGTNGPERNTGGAGGRAGKVDGVVPLDGATRVWALIGCGGSGGTGANGFADGGNGGNSNSGGGGGATGLCLGTSTASCGSGDVVAIAGGGGGGGRASDNGGWPCGSGVNGAAGGEGSGGTLSTGGTGGENGGNGDGGGAGSTGGGGDGGRGGGGGGGTGEAAASGSAATNGVGGGPGTNNTDGVKGNNAPAHPTVPAVSYGSAGKGGNAGVEDGIPGGGGGGGLAGGGGGAAGDRSIGACVGSWDGGGGGGAGASWVRSTVTGDTFASAATSGSCSTTNPGLAGGTNGGNGCAGSVSVTWVINTLPTGAGQTGLTATKGVGLPITLAATDADIPDGDSVSCEIVAQPGKGALTGSGCGVTYTAAPDTSGADSFTYRVRDEWDGLSATTYTIALTVQNRAPTGANQGPLPATKGTALPITLAAADLDADTLTCEIVTGPAKGSVNGGTPGTSCVRSYTASSGQYGTDSFTYRVRDSVGATSTTHTVSLAIQNRPLTIGGQAYSVVAGAPTVVTLSGIDPDDDPQTCTVTTPPTKASLTGSGCTRTYTSSPGSPNAGFGGTDTFSYTAADGEVTAGPATDTVTIVNPDLALAKMHTGRFNEGTGTGTYTLAVSSTSAAPANGTTTLTDTLPAGMVFRSAAVGSSGFTCSATPGVSTTVTCTRAAAIPASASLSLTITVDVTAGAASPATNTAVVSSLYELAATATDNTASDPTDVNHRPTAADQAVGTTVDSAVLVTLAGTDADGDALTFQVVTGPASGSLFGSGGTKQYVPNSGFTGVDSFTYTVTDSGDPGLVSTTKTVTIYVGVSDLGGVVTDDVSSLPVAGVEARLVDMADPQAGVLVTTVLTNASGAYSFGAVPYGTYGIRFVDPSNDHISEWFDDAPTSATATLFTLSVETPSVTRSVGLRPGGRIVGTVRSTEVPNAPIADLQVRLVKVGSPGSAAKATSASGAYAFELLQPGTYQLWFRDLASGQWISEWYGNVGTQSESTSIPVAIGQQVVIDEQISPVAPPPPPDSGSVSGTVEAAGTGQPLAGVQVRLYKAPYTGSAAATTDANGQYSFGRLAPGTYKLWFRDMSGTRVSEYGGDASTLAEADTLGVANDGHVVDAALALKAAPPAASSGVVSGTVLEVDGFTPIVGLQVRLYKVGGTGSAATTTDANGSYAFTGLVPGQYQVFFRDLGRTWFSEWHLDAATQTASTPVSAVNGQTTDVDTTLNRK